VAAALAEVGVAAEAAVYSEEFADEVRDQLLGVDGVLVWVDPVTGSRDRAQLDRLLRDVSGAGVWVSAHPDVIARMGTKEVLYRTRSLGWGSDVQLYRTAEEFKRSFPATLASGPRVLKQYRGNGGIGVWKVGVAGDDQSAGNDPVVKVQSARSRDGAAEQVALSAFMDRAEKYFGYNGGEGRLIDQAFQPLITQGIVRCYLVKAEVVGFSRQYPPDVAPECVFGLPSAKTMFGPDEASFARLRRSMEEEWVPGLQELVGVDYGSLPALWDADFLFAAKDPEGADSYVLSEINVSAVAPFPAPALPKLARAVAAAPSAR